MLIGLVLLSFLPSCFVCKNLSRIGQPPCSMKGLAVNGAVTVLTAAAAHFPVCQGLKRGLSEVVSSVHEDKGLRSTDHV